MYVGSHRAACSRNINNGLKITSIEIKKNIHNKHKVTTTKKYLWLYGRAARARVRLPPQLSGSFRLCHWSLNGVHTIHVDGTTTTYTCIQGVDAHDPQCSCKRK